ncbi:MAG: RIP metalloprotease RseP [Betaproteobacteria bacterium]
MNNFLFYAAAFSLALGTLIVAHELGHFLVARWAGVKVLRFSVGFGQSVWSKRLGNDRTEWSIGIFPLGGYVKMLDEREGEVSPEELHRSFNRQSVWRRMAIVVAGPLANLILAVFLYWGVFWYGTEELQPLLGPPVASSPAAAAGFVNGERVLKVAGDQVQTWQEVRWVLLRRAVDQDSIELEVINSKNEIAIRRLDVSQVREKGLDSDTFEKLGLRFYQPHIPPVIGKLTPEGSAAMAGLHVGDEIVLINQHPVSSWSEVVQQVRASPGVALAFAVTRANQQLFIEVTPALVEEGGQQIGRIGAAVMSMGVETRNQVMITVHYSLIPALGKAINETWDKTHFTLVMIKKMFTGDVSLKNISGPVTIADYAGQSARLGIDHYLKFMALISISLAVLNLLPIPILDGGHLLYYVAEVIRRKPLSERSIEMGQKIGLVLMVMLMVCSFYNDINRLISG